MKLSKTNPNTIDLIKSLTKQSSAEDAPIWKAVAKELGFIYVDTGALYRTVGLKLTQCGNNAEDEKSVEEILKTTKVDIKYIDGEQRVFLDGIDVSHLIRTPEMSMMASKCSALPVVRAYLLNMQREIAENNSVIMDGRDIATVVLPNAEVKIFLTASAKARADRRYKELIAKGENVNYDDVYDKVKKITPVPGGVGPMTVVMLMENVLKAYELQR